MFASKISLRGLDGREEEDLRARLSKFFATQIDEVVWQWLPNGIWKLDAHKQLGRFHF